MKRIISMILAVMLVLSVAAIAVSAESFHGWDERAQSMKDAIAAYEAEHGVTIPTRRYYFQVPDGNNGPAKEDGTKAGSWFNEYNEGLCSVYYWFTPTADKPEAGYPVEEWTGYLCETGDAANIFYVDVPAAVTTIIFNNSVNGGSKPEVPEDNPYYFCCAQTANIVIDTAPTAKTKVNKKLVYANYPADFFTNFRVEGDDEIANFDGMILIPTPDAMNVNSFSGAQTIGGSWYYYYGNGCYGYTIDATDMKTSCLNPDHDHSNDQPETSAPETSAPETSAPETSAPETSAPETTAPETSAPGTEAEDVYYLVGTINKWAETSDYVFEKNTAAEEGVNEYTLTVTLTAGDEVKARCGDDWYPDGMDNNYVAAADGEYTFYLRPDGNGNEDWIADQNDDTRKVLYVVAPEIPSEPATDEPATEPETQEPATEPETQEPGTEPATNEPGTEPETTTPGPTEPETHAETTAPVADGFYLAGDMNKWTPVAEYQLELNEAADGTEYQIKDIELTTASQLKVVEVDGADRYWYPDGMGNNFGEHGEITENGVYTIYFRPDADGGSDWFNGCIYAVCTQPETTEPYTGPTEEPTDEPPTVLPATDEPATEPATDEPATEPATQEPATEPAPVENKIHFDNTTTGWDEESQVYCHIFAYGGDAFFEWQTKKEKCTDNEDGTWTYDLDAKKVELDPDKMYCVLFSNEDGEETYQLFMDTTCMGDTAYCDGTQTENPVNSNLKSYTAYWRNQDKTEYGPVLAISSIGNVVGSACAPGTTPEQMFEDFLTNTLDNAREYSGKNDQQLIDDIKDGLGLADSQVEEAIEKTGAEVEWEPAPVPDEGTGILGDADGDGKVTVIDATYIQKKLASIKTPTKFFEKEADVNASGNTDILDATWIQRKLASIATPYPIGEKING